jgi:hypothetical protein
MVKKKVKNLKRMRTKELEAPGRQWTEKKKKTIYWWRYGVGKQKIKRVADFLEKLAVAGIAVGIFQDNYSGIIPAVTFFVVSLALTKEA